MIPYSRNPGFINRKPALQQLNDHLTLAGKPHKSRLVLFGLGGVGCVYLITFNWLDCVLTSLSKSQIAIEFAYRIHFERPHTSIFWIHASSPDRFREGYYNIIDECDIPTPDSGKCDKKAFVKGWLENECREWLMIIDNADEASLFTSGKTPQSKSSTAESSILDYLPQCDHGTILITTRDRAVAVKFTKGSISDLIEVKPMTETESGELVKSVMAGSPSNSEIGKLADLLGYLPLAMVQAAAFIEENMISVGEYLELCEENHDIQMDLLCEDFEALGRDSHVPNAVATTLAVSINQIKEKHPQAIEILSLIAFFDKNDIPEYLIRPKSGHPLEFARALGTLKAFSLIQGNDKGKSYSLHRLVQLAIRKWLLIADDFKARAVRALEVVDEAFPDAIFENWKTCELCLPHAKSVLRFIPELHGKLFRTKLHIQEGVAYYLWTQGHYDEAEKLDLIILEANKKEFGLRHPETLESMCALASTYEDQGRLSEAEELDKHVLQVRKEENGIKDKETLVCMGNLAGVYEKQGRLDEAEALTLEVLKNRTEIFGSNHEATITSMAKLGSIYYEAEQYQKAEELTLQAWHWRKANLGHSHKDTLTCGHTLAMIYDGRDELEKAAAQYSEMLALREEQLGPNHPETF